MTNHTSLTTEQLAEIEARVNAATEGPWCTDAWEIYQGSEYQPGLSMWIGETCRGTSTPEQDQADAAFIAAARTDVPALLAEVRRLQAQRKYLLTQLAKRDAESGRGGAALRDFLSEPIPPAAEAVHGLPVEGSGLTPCCARTPFELPRTDRMTQNDANVTCAAAGESGSTR